MNACSKDLEGVCSNIYIYASLRLLCFDVVACGVQVAGCVYHVVCGLLVLAILFSRTLLQFLSSRLGMEANREEE